MKNKRGISAVVGYVLLISITITLSASVYNWLKYYVTSDQIEECSDNVNIIISEYECYSRVYDYVAGTTEEGNISITLKNKGLFSVDGYILRFDVTDDSEFGIYMLNETGTPLAPGESVNYTYDFGDIEDAPDPLRSISIIDVQPFRNGEDGNVSCRSYITQKVVCQ